MPRVVNPDYIPPNYNPNYRTPQTRPAAQPADRSSYDYFAERRELNRVRQQQIAEANRRMQALMAQEQRRREEAAMKLAQRRAGLGNRSWLNYQNGYNPYITTSTAPTTQSPTQYVTRAESLRREPSSWYYPNGYSPYAGGVSQVASPTTVPTRTPQRPAYRANMPGFMRDAIASGQISPNGYDPYEVGGAAYGSVGNNLQTIRERNAAEWEAIWALPRETLAELLARGAVDPWADDPYEIGGASTDWYLIPEEAQQDSYGGWGGGYGGWGGGGGSYSSSPGIYGDSVRKNQWYSTLVQWNLT